MNNTWIDHLEHWKEFLKTKLLTTEDEGEKRKTVRQLTAIERVSLSAVLNPNLLTEFINPITKSGEINNLAEYYLPLNMSQKKAVSTAINGEQNLTLIQGPPGTGKTQVIAEICLQLFQRNSNIRVLVCSETHVAVNNLISRISLYNSDVRCLRIRDKEQSEEVDSFSPKAIIDLYCEWLNEVCPDKDVVDIIVNSLPNEDDISLEKALALSANVVGMTCNRVGAYHFSDTTEMFDVVIIDEVCKATLPEILMPLTISNKAVLVGDPKQLPPVFCSEDIEVINNIEKFSLQKYMYIDTLFGKTSNTVILDTQYRMEKKIGELISTLFYNGLLKDGRNVELRDNIRWIDYKPTHPWPEVEKVIDDKPIIRNLDECQIIRKELDKLENEAQKRTVAVIAPYKNQIYELKRIIPDYENIIVTIDTVDGFQGKETDIVFFSLTRTVGSYRFLADSRRLNVALSRARDSIIIVGNREYAANHILLSKIMAYCD